MRIHRTIEATVPVFLPLAGAAVLALAASAAGPRLAPAALAAGLLAVALLATAVHRTQAEHIHAMSDREARRRRLRQLLLALAATIATALVVVLSAPTPLTRMSREQLATTLREDTKLYRGTERSLDAVLARLQSTGVPPASDQEVLTAEQERILADSWRALVDHVVMLESLRRYYDSYYLLDLSDHRDEHVLAFLLTFAADVTLYEAASEFTARVLANGNAQKFLDAPRDGMPAGCFSRFREDLLGASDQLRLAAGKGYLEAVEAMGVSGPLAASATELVERIRTHLGAIEKRSGLEHNELTYRAELQRLKRTAVRLWYPVQARVAELLGDTRVRRPPGRYLIDRALREHVDRELEPGDILLARKNWYLSNIGLPGFWPHAMVYLGDRDKLEGYFDDEQVRRWVATIAGEPMSLTEMLERRHPEAWSAYLEPHHGEPRRVVEAISEGVSFSTLEECAGDYLAGLRPRLDKIDKATAIVFAFVQYRKPYDFDFDFATDHALVCTELVWRAYREAPARRSGIDFSLVPVAGRMTLPANEIASKYAREIGTPGAELDFVLFVDAREDVATAFVSSEEAFRASYRRTKWDLAQE